MHAKLDSQDPLDELVAPLVVGAVDALTVRLSAQALPVECNPLQNLATHLRDRIARMSMSSVAREISVATDRTSGSNVWNEWIAEQRASGLTGLWQKYPALSRLIDSVSLNWVDRSAELLQRAAADASMIGTQVGKPLSHLFSVGPPLSDFHDGSAAVHACTFIDNDGESHTVIYKPSDQGAAQAYRDLVRWLNIRGGDLGEPSWVINRGTHGWAEFVEAAPVESSSQTGRHFNRAGRLCALAYALGSADLHTENVVAVGDRLVIIDAETIMSPAAARESPSVLQSRLLPDRSLVRHGRETAALGSDAGARHVLMPQVEWAAPGTSAAHLIARSVPGVKRHSQLRDTDGNPVSASENVEHVLAGFEEMWEILTEHQPQLLAPDGPLAAFTSVMLRVVARPTATYTQLLIESQRWQLLTSDIARSQHFRSGLTKAPLDESFRGEPLIEVEVADLDGSDIPRLALRADETSLNGPSGQQLATFDVSGLERARNRIRLLSAQGLSEQLAAITTSLRDGQAS